jgi:putative FmdB family regulatory protein
VPIYEYRCDDCGRQFEVAQRMSDDPVTECETCGGHVTRVLFAPAIHFKGKGFHNTDYGTKRRPVGEGGEGGGDGAAKKDGAAAGTSDSSSKSGSGDSGSSGKTVGLDKV